jgi:Uma2 family endonuclease
MNDPARRRATYEDVLAAPEHMVAEIVDGKLRLQPRPAKPHAAAATALGEELGPPFKRGKGGPGGWIILDEPEIHLGEDIVVPDLGGWRRQRMPALVDDEPYFTVAPDWICEVLSPNTATLDRAKKLPIYAREGVSHAWLVDPRARTLEVLRLEGRNWLVLGVFADDARVRAEPFEVFELELGILWADVILRDQGL